MNIEINQKILNQKSKNLNLEKVPKRLISILQLDENDKIYKDPDYNTLKEYNAPILKKK
ncbi:hypothetical protein RhiirC2_797743 [Rhizophagus irregularis]|uniref:Uncharacterized protein n=1 Tax=Rhizophagus irregularis TaxID=588596 RepID=A0A2N1M7J2_9GLOM|nr:hypothetical protein RhiirC2_797743 [Rhizophagus irregularis]